MALTRFDNGGLENTLLPKVLTLKIGLREQERLWALKSLK
jgi:hypothetical protein